MSVTNFSFREPEHKIGENITADVFVRFDPGWTRTIASHPVEGGSSISDHIVLDPRTVTVEGIISDAPIDYKIIYTTPDFLERIRDVYDEFLKMWKDKSSTTLVDIVSGHKEAKNMCLVSFSAPDDETNGNALKFTAVFKEFRFAQKKYVDIEFLSKNLNNDIESASEADIGDQPPGEISAGDKKASLLYRGAEYLAGVRR